MTHKINRTLEEEAMHQHFLQQLNTFAEADGHIPIDKSIYKSIIERHRERTTAKYIAEIETLKAMLAEYMDKGK